MANKVLLKKSSVAAKVPLTTDLDYGEVALNYNDAKLFFKKSDGTTVDHFPSATATSTLSNKTLLNPIVTADASTVALQINRVSGQPSIKSGGTDGYLIMDNTTGLGGVAAINWYSTDNVILAQGGGNVGVGTITPGERLRIQSTGTGQERIVRIQNSAASPYTLDFGSLTNGAYIEVGNSGILGLTTGGSVKVTLNSDGNTGFGITPSSWGTTGTYPKTIELWNGGALNGYLAGFTDASFQLGVNSYYNGGWKYKASGLASNYFQQNGGHVFRVAATGTADAAITWTDALRITSSAHVGLGVTPSAWGGIATNVIEFQGGGHFFGVAADNYISVGSNTYFDGTNWIGKTSGRRATMYHQDSGRHEWFSTTGNVTAGATAAFNEVMQLDINACLSIGTGGGVNGALQDYIRIAGSNANSTDYHAIGNYSANELYVQANTYTNILRGYAYTTSNRKMNAADAAIRITNNSIFLAYDLVGNVNIGYNTDQSAYKLAVNGAFAATTKSFLIDHPTKEGMRLRYGSLEGPENGVYVRGRLTNGNTIELPEYWTKLVDPDSITVDLTPIGSHQKLYVKDIVNNTVVVGNENVLSKTINCFYTVYAERIDVEKLEVEIEQ